MSMTVPPGTVCANPDCGHSLAQHGGDGGKTIEDLKSAVYPCLWVDKQTTSFAVCACRDYLLPARNQPIFEVAPSPLPEPGQDVVEWPLGPGTKLQLHPDGRVTWFAG